MVNEIGSTKAVKIFRQAEKPTIKIQKLEFKAFFFRPGTQDAEQEEEQEYKDTSR